MSDLFTNIDELALAARSEEPPSVDVSSQVLASIRERETAYGYTPLQWIAVGSTIAAAAMSLTIVSLYEMWSDPLNILFFNLFWGLL